MAATLSAFYPETIFHFDLQQEIDDASSRRPWAAGIFSKTLLKQDDMRVLLTLMDQGATMNEHHADGSVSIQVLLGLLRVKTQEGVHSIPARHLLVLEPSAGHDVRAVEPSAFLLTISWPDSEKLRAMPHRGYGS
ncbi:MAG: hypothetical protein M1568_02230 [Acidobacteria bacterium]|jgi:quercetin dioxygenase-like cupin family protein|nr:hypothetical protein [Acidobacteriota bacterium]